MVGLIHDGTSYGGAVVSQTRCLDAEFDNAAGVFASLGGLRSAIVRDLHTVQCIVAPCIAHMVASTLSVPHDAVMAVVAFRDALPSNGCCTRHTTTFFTLSFELPCGLLQVVRRLLTFAFYRLLPRRIFAHRGAALVIARLEACPNRTDLDNGQFAALFRTIAEECDAAKEGPYRLPYIDIWQVMSPTTYLSDRVLNYMIAKVRTLCASQSALRSLVHIPNTHFIVRARNDKAGPANIAASGSASRRLFGLPPSSCSNGRVRLPRLTLVVLHDPVGKHWSLAAVLKQMSPPATATPYPFMIIHCDSLATARTSRAIPEGIAVLRRWLVTHTEELKENVQASNVPWCTARNLPVQTNSFDCALFVVATMHAFLRLLVAESVMGQLSTPHFAELQWSSNEIPNLRREFLQDLNGGCPVHHDDHCAVDGERPKRDRG